MRISDWSSDVCSSDLKAPLERRVFFDIFAIFVERRRADAMQFAACERGLEQVRGVHRTLALARADQRVHLVDEQDDLALGRLDVVEHALQPLLELAAIFRSEEPTSELKSLMRTSFAVFCVK